MTTVNVSSLAGPIGTFHLEEGSTVSQLKERIYEERGPVSNIAISILSGDAELEDNEVLQGEQPLNLQALFKTATVVNVKIGPREPKTYILEVGQTVADLKEKICATNGLQAEPLARLYPHTMIALELPTYQRLADDTVLEQTGKPSTIQIVED